MKSLKEILEELIYNKCCQTITKKKFAPYDKAIIQTHSQIKALLPDEEEIYDMLAGVGEPLRTRITKALAKRIGKE